MYSETKNSNKQYKIPYQIKDTTYKNYPSKLKDEIIFIQTK